MNAFSDFGHRSESAKPAAEHAPLGYVKSSLSGEVGRMADIWENKDFYGNEIWNVDDPLPEKVLEGIRHLFPLPLALSRWRGGRCA